MTFCLARPNDWTVIVAALAVVTIVVSCEHPVTDPSSSIAQLVVSPQNVTLQQNQAEDFLAVGFTATGDSADIAVSWGATGDRKSTRLNSSHPSLSRMPSSA